MCQKNEYESHGCICMGDNFQLFCVKSEWNLCEQRQDNWQDKEKFTSF